MYLIRMVVIGKIFLNYKMEVTYGREAEKTIQLKQPSSGRRDNILLKDMWKTEIFDKDIFPTTFNNFK